MRKQTITLEIRYNETKDDSPNGWDWASVLDEPPENVKIISSTEPEVCLADDDIEHCRETYEELKNDEEKSDHEEVMTSLGYVQVWSDGEVIYFGDVIHKFED